MILITLPAQFCYEMHSLIAMVVNLDNLDSLEKKVLVEFEVRNAYAIFKAMIEVCATLLHRNIFPQNNRGGSPAFIRYATMYYARLGNSNGIVGVIERL